MHRCARPAGRCDVRHGIEQHACIGVLRRGKQLGGGRDLDEAAMIDGAGPFRITRSESGAVVHLALPHVTRDEVGLARHGDELVVSVASYRRLLTLPPGLGRHQIAGARVVGGELQVRFKEGAS